MDGHERPAMIKYWKGFKKRYLAYEVRMHCSVQVKEEVAKELEEEGDII